LGSSFWNFSLSMRSLITPNSNCAVANGERSELVADRTNLGSVGPRRRFDTPAQSQIEGYVFTPNV
jgi:hypothetical protein